jgi:hypothetical protein
MGMPWRALVTSLKHAGGHDLATSQAVLVISIARLPRGRSRSELLDVLMQFDAHIRSGMLPLGTGHAPERCWQYRFNSFSVGNQAS